MKSNAANIIHWFYVRDKQNSSSVEQVTYFMVPVITYVSCYIKIFHYFFPQGLMNILPKLFHRNSNLVAYCKSIFDHQNTTFVHTLQ